jgi:biopolymer transport protein ExbD
MERDPRLSSWAGVMRSHPKDKMDLLPFLDVLLIGLFVSLNFSSFIMAPGIEVTLPESSHFSGNPSAPVAVLTIDRNELYFFEGQMLTWDSLKGSFERYLSESRANSAAQKDALLLLKAHRDLPLEVLIKSMDLANETGFTSIHLATEFYPEGAEPFGFGVQGP